MKLIDRRRFLKNSLLGAAAVSFADRSLLPAADATSSDAPGIIDTVRDLSQYPDVVDTLAADSFEARRRAIPVRRFGLADEVAAACCYLCSEHGAFVTGQVLHVNGGEFMF